MREDRLMDKPSGIWTQENDNILNQYLFKLVVDNFEKISDFEIDELDRDCLRNFIIRWTHSCFIGHQEKQNWYSACYSQGKSKGCD